MRLIDRVSNELIETNRTVIQTPRTTFTGVLNTKFKDSWDFFMHDNTTPVGYAVVMKSRDEYELMNNSDINIR